MLKRDEAQQGAANALSTEVLQESAMELADRWILSRFTAMQQEMAQAISVFDVNAYSKIMYDFVWHDFCDVYVEIVKNRLQRTSDAHLQRALCGFAVSVFEQALLYLHPVMPFITEEIWQTLRSRAAGETIMCQQMPATNAALRNESAESQMEVVMNLVERIRQLRNENSVPPTKALVALARVPAAVRNVTKSFICESWLGEQKITVEELTRLTIAVNDDSQMPAIKASSVVNEIEIFLSLEGLIDVDKERARLTKEIERLRNLFDSTTKKLANPSFADRAPADVVEKERSKLTSFTESIAKLEESLGALK
jgi:valyl-tRNA synthetase